jgi:hypothetical protein
MTQTLHRRPEQPHAAPYNPQYGASIPTSNPWDQAPNRRFDGPRPGNGHQFGGPVAPQHAPQPAYAQQAFAQQFDVKPPRTNRKVLLFGGGAVLAIVALVVALIVVLATGNAGSSRHDELIQAGDLTSENSKPSKEPTSAPEPTSRQKPTSAPAPQSTTGDEQEIVQVVEDFTKAAITRVQALTLPYYCQANRDAILRSGETGVIVPTKNFDGSAPTDIQVTGTHATGDLNGELIEFLKENGGWTICMTG